ncbi:stage 0 sporulation protein A [Ruminiclostridium hungatei]|uniref:Stage 0 sporulation protein A n=1 Tax=Ruminiclostridium hungatei TaxID=48256 RepID=A0A1V4SSR6_RUMHU|nr:sporulation initiation factor Spo0A C-terminal domain-containing protein [Ruminiclostridium hungatei]OPX46341.1 stage 0 sporulation protein A [Ruminiclostridium hungatei]
MQKTFNDDGTITINMTEHEYFNSVFGNKQYVQASVNSTPINTVPANTDLETLVTNLLNSIGMPRNIKGFHYVRQAISLAVENPDIVDGMTKELYPAIAKSFQAEPSRAERAIRHAIEVAWDRGNEPALSSLFGYSISQYKGKSTNSEFIALMADNLRLQLKEGGRGNDGEVQ